ncbi:MAG: undecaprenyldiphospho-muramoylpentapeptide beta-N-acetylglucosaminyltransferase [Spirochaetales bacterium]|nr:undecaprenyldiphospho-muramoylpentapeptide beta-N-acetylglucosaminyltransferase [Spirochaetales bacterium]
MAQAINNGFPICFTGGGTGGHVIPGLAVIEQIQKKFDVNVIWIGSGKGIEKKLISDAGIRFAAIPAGKLRRYFSLRNLIDMFKVVAGIVRSWFILKKCKPLVVFSKGGYVTVPPVIAAGFLKIPVVTHESDFDPGLATRIASGRAAKICVSYPQTADYFHAAVKSKIVVTGNPVRSAILSGDPKQGKQAVGCPSSLPLVFVLGGSLGSKAVNTLVDGIKENCKDTLFIVHQRGAGNPDTSGRVYPHVFTRDFFYSELPHILAASSLVISRAGANTLWELAAAQKPSILVPLVAGSRGDQVRNAAVFEKIGAARVLDEKTATPQQLLEIIRDCVDNKEKLKAMSTAAGSIFKPEAASRIAEVIMNCAQERKTAADGN